MRMHFSITPSYLESHCFLTMLECKFVFTSVLVMLSILLSITCFLNWNTDELGDVPYNLFETGKFLM